MGLLYFVNMRKVQLLNLALLGVFAPCSCLLQVLLGKCNSLPKGNIYAPRCHQVIETEADKLSQEVFSNYSVFQYILSMTQLLEQFIIWAW